MSQPTEIPGPKEQAEIIKELADNETLVDGGKVYLIESRWYRNWKTYVDYPVGQYTDDYYKPDEIDNKSLFLESGELDTCLSEPYDYCVVVPGVWNKLLEWYGGGPEASVDVVYSVSRKQNVAAMKTKKLILVHKTENGTEEQEVTVHTVRTIKWLKSLAMEKFGIANDVTTRLIDWWQDRFYAELDDEHEISQCQLQENQKVLLDVKDAQGEWKENKEDDTYTYTPTTQTIQSSTYSTQYSGYSRLPGYSRYSSYSRNYGEWKGPGKVGLSNMGNTCFFNSGIQCLMHTMPLMEKFLKTDWQVDINEINPIGTKGKVVKAFGSLVEEIWKGQYGVVEPSDLKYQIGEFAPQFSGWGQQDSHELITFMLDAIHEDLNRCRQKPYVESIDGDGTNDDEISQIAWDRHKQRNDSIIVDLFHAQLRSELWCPNCKKTTVVFDPYNSLPLPLQKSQLQECNVVFVPLDITKPFIEMTLMLPPEPTMDAVTRAVSELLKRDVKIVFGCKRYNNKVEWGTVQEEGYYYRSDNKYVFEIDDSAKFWVPCEVKMAMWNTYRTYSDNKTVIGPFMIPFDSEDVSMEAVEEAAKAKLDWIWKKEDPTKQENEQVTEPQNNKEEKNEEEEKKEEGNHKTHEGSFWDSDDDSTPESSDDNSDDDSDLTETEKKLKRLISDKGSPRTKDLEGKVQVYSYSEDERKILPSVKVPYVSRRFIEINVSHKAVNINQIVRHLCMEVEKITQEADDESSGVLTLEKCFDYFTSGDVLDEQNQWFCPKCRQHVCAHKKMDIWSVPNVLVIQLKRFITSTYDTRKLDTEVAYPDVLDITKYVVGPQKDTPQRYKLYAVSEHMGGTGGGHYIAHAVVPNEDGSSDWYEFNDSQAYKTTAADAHNRLGYVLFYVREGAEPTTVLTEEHDDSSDPESSSSRDDFNL